MASADHSIFTTLTIAAIKKEADDFKTFVFAKGHSIKWKSGQFLTLVQMINGGEVRRSYSITASPIAGEPLAVGIKRITNGIFSRQVYDKARVGDKWITTGAAGFFILPGDIVKYESIFFFAAGSGITPIFSLLKTVLINHPQMKVVLVYSNHAPGSTIFLAELTELQKNNAHRFYIEYIFSNNPDLRRAHLNRDFLHQLLEQYQPSAERTLFYTCGPEAYMRMVIYQLQETGFPKEHIKKEDFVLNRPAPPLKVPPDKDRHKVMIQLYGHQHHFEVQYPDTILSAAKKQGLQLPYSCETGRCGSCAALCLQGKVWMANNEVLTDKELQQGIILTCVGYPMGGDVVLQVGSPTIIL